MRRQVGWAIASVISAGLAGQGGASAADLAYKARPPVMTEVFSWTGFYIGGNVGYAWGSGAITGREVAPVPPFSAVDIAAVSAAASPRLKSDGFTGGAQAGYNWQTGSTVFGVEADIDSLNLRGRTTGVFPFPSTPTRSFSSTSSVSTDWLFTGRGRLGWANDQWLLYATGGVAVTNVNVNQSIALFAPFVFNATTSSTRVGYTVGGGFEYAVNRNWSVKGEYLYVDFGTMNGVGVLTPGFAGFAYTNSTHLTANIARAGLNYHFGDPMLAKY